MNNRPRVALIALHFAEYSAHLAMALAKDIDILLILYRNNADNELGDSWQHWIDTPNLTVKVLDRPSSASSVVRNISSLVNIVREFRPSLIHLQEDVRDELFFALQFFRRLPLVLTIHDPVTHSGRDSLRLRFSRLRLYRFLARRSATAAIAHGRVLASTLEVECPWLKGKIWSIPHGPLGLRNASTTTIKPKGVRLLFFGRIHRYKGLQYFVESIKALHRAGMPVIGVVAGRGSDLDAHRAEMVSAGCFEILDHFIPAEDVPALFTTARAVVLPYIDGTQSGVAAMALGFGCPVIASAVGSIPELVRDGKNGLLVAPTDTHALTKAIGRVLLDDALYSTLCEGAQGLRDGELSWTTIASQTRNCYDSLLPSRRTECR